MTELQTAEFFAPSNIDMVDGLISRYQESFGSIERAAEYTQGNDFTTALGYFITGSSVDGRHREAPKFDAQPAFKALNANFWKIALDLTDVLDFMPAKRRDEWFESITKMETPDFEEATVRSTLDSLLSQRMDFLAEKVDGIFQALSRTHVTNQPEGFSKRMILTGVTNDWGSYGSRQTGHVNDLRTVIAKFMGRDEPDYNASNRLVEIARSQFRGEWLDVDGGALRIRCYLNGNAHLEVHPDMSWRLNQILAHLHPSAIPSRLREKPKRKQKDYVLMDRPLPFAVLDVLHRMKPVYSSKRNVNGTIIEPVTDNKNNLEADYSYRDKHVLKEVEEVLALLGGVKISQKGRGWFEFDYSVNEIISEIVCTGCIPDHKSHQFYPTPEHIARDAVGMAGITSDHECLEPSAGIGGLADHMGACGSITCVEVSALHCGVLRSKGYYVDQSDFLKYTEKPFDRIVMNPPFSQGRWQAHIEHAATLLAEDGVMVAILPSSAAGKDVLPGMAISWSNIYKNEFRGASVDVVIMKASKG